jgi:hypothetical protein
MTRRRQGRYSKSGLRSKAKTWREDHDDAKEYRKVIQEKQMNKICNDAKGNRPQ